MYISATNGIAKPIVDTSSTNANIRALVLDDQDLLNVEDLSMVLLVKLKDVNSISNMYVFCRNEGGGSVDENSFVNLNDLNDLKETISKLASNEIQHPISKENMDQEDDINKVYPEIAVSSDLSRPSGFEHMKRSSSKCSTSFARSRKKDIKGLSTIKELSRITDVGDSLDDTWCDDAFTIVKGHWRNMVGDCYMINIYGPHDSLAKATLQNIVGDFIHQHADILDTFESFDLFQKARVKWDIEGDENSKFFHGMIKQNKESSNDSRYHERRLCTLNRDSLEIPISLDKVKKAVWDFGSSKSLGPDGFSFAFVKKY
nr:RNA-directed DNA polymerase, eukaryota, reverse transcriptase zinc-binding domain protein [Tanacetum cinerariifolium]